MRVRYLLLIVSLFFAGLFAEQIAFAHPPNLHDDTAQTQDGQTQESQAQETKTQTFQELSPQQDETANHQHDDNAAADHHADGSESSEHSHDGGGHEAGGDETGGHSHWGISPDSSPFSKVMAGFGKFHPLIVHFPIALFLTAAFAQVLNMRSKDGSYDKAVTLLVWLGAFGALGAGLLGWSHSGPMQSGENTVMSAHRWIGTSLLIGGLVTAYLMTKAKKTEGGLKGNTVFNVFLFATALGVAVNGFLGGALAHGGLKHLMPGMM